MENSNFGKWLIFIGIGIVIVGLIFWFIGKSGLPLGKLPGDIHLQKEKISFFFPVVTCIVASIFLTIILNLILWFLRK